MSSSIAIIIALSSSIGISIAMSSSIEIRISMGSSTEIGIGNAISITIITNIIFSNSDTYQRLNAIYCNRNYNNYCYEFRY